MTYEEKVLKAFDKEFSQEILTEYWLDTVKLKSFISSVLKKQREELTEEKMLFMAEAQLLGFYHREHGGEIEELVESMGLTKEEWVKIQKDFSPAYMSDDEKKEVSEITNLKNKRL